MKEDYKPLTKKDIFFVSLLGGVEDGTTIKKILSAREGLKKDLERLFTHSYDEIEFDNPYDLVDKWFDIGAGEKR